jgi:hypothetical protein
MSLLPTDTYVNSSRQLWASQGSGGGGGSTSSLQSPATILAAPSGLCQLTMGSVDSAPATFTVTSNTGGADTGTSAINIIGGTNATLTVNCDGAGSAIAEIAGGTAGNATVNVLSQGANLANLNMGISTTFATVSCNAAGNLSLTPSSGVTALTVVNSPPSLLATGLKLQDAGGQQGAITGQNNIKNPLNNGVPVSQTAYPLAQPPVANVGWWLYSIGTTDTATVNVNSVQSCVSSMAYWNGATFGYGGNVAQPLGGIGGWTANQFAQLFLSNDRSTVSFFFNDGSTTGALVAMYYTATQMTGAVPGF